MDKIKVFLSSRVNSKFQKWDYRLTDLRSFLRKEIEKEKIFGDQLVEIVINEENFKGNFTKNAFDGCMQTMREAHIIIILYNGEAGWSALDTETNGICHEEFLIAVNEFSGLAFGIDLSQHFVLEKKGREHLKNVLFQEDVVKMYRPFISIQADSQEDLELEVLTQVKSYINKSILDSIFSKKMDSSSSSTYGPTLDWSKDSYSERVSNLTSVLRSAFGSMTEFGEVIKSYHAIPDNMSVADARNMIQRPFLVEHDLIQDHSDKKAGVIHLVAVYGNATEIQVKNLVGYPDLTVIKGSFGLYLWDKVQHIQMFFLIKCINPQTIRTRLIQVINWLNASNETAKIVRRAEGRWQIISKIHEMQEIARDK